jgi:hypothetical protein
VAEARRILSYMENLPEEAMPPEMFWHSAHKCKEWIDSHHPALQGNKKSTGMLEFNDDQIEKAT